MGAPRSRARAAGPPSGCPGVPEGRLGQARAAGCSHRGCELGQSGHHHVENLPTGTTSSDFQDTISVFVLWGNGQEGSEVYELGEGEGKVQVRLCKSSRAARDLVAAGQGTACSGAGLSQKDRKSGPVLKWGTVGCIWACGVGRRDGRSPPSLPRARRGISPLRLAACSSHPACIRKHP